MRMFVAVCPPPDVLDDLAEFLAPRQDVASPLRWTAPEQWHLTLAFLARVEDRNLDALDERLTRLAAQHARFTLTLGGSGAFPHPGAAKVLWVGVQDEQAATELSRLARGARAAANTAGVEVDGTRFTPHLTLARLGRPIEATRWLGVLGTWRSRPWRVEGLALIESHLGEGSHRHPRYEVREVFPLAG